MTDNESSAEGNYELSIRFRLSGRWWDLSIERELGFPVVFVFYHNDLEEHCAGLYLFRLCSRRVPSPALLSPSRQ
eukprot:756303-Hanusia_phi.AAC.1